MLVKIQLKEGGKTPQYQTVNSAGADCYARLEEPVILLPKAAKPTLIPLGFSLELSHYHEAQIRGRSGLDVKSSVVCSLGTIDSDFRGEVHAIIRNLGDEPFTVNNGDRIAQIVVKDIEQAKFIESVQLSSTVRGEGGFGHTGL